MPCSVFCRTTKNTQDYSPENRYVFRGLQGRNRITCGPTLNQWRRAFRNEHRVAFFTAILSSIPVMAPVASSSRRTRRQPSEEISEDPGSQKNKVEDVEVDSGDEDKRPRGKTTTRKGKRGKRKQTAPTDKDETMIDVDLDDEDIPDEPFDRDALLNQPLSQKQKPRLISLASDATAAPEAYKQDVMEMATRLAGNIAEFLKNNQDKVGAVSLERFNVVVNPRPRLSKNWIRS